MPKVVLTLGSAFARVASRSEGDEVENTTPTSRWTYTVPSDKIAHMVTGYVVMAVEVVFTSSTTTDLSSCKLRITPTGGSITDMLNLTLASVSVLVNDHAQLAVGESGFLEAGDIITGEHTCAGDSAGAGRVHMASGASFEEYDD